MGHVRFGIHLGHIGSGVAENHLSRLQPVLPAHPCPVCVPELVRVPVVVTLPELHPAALFGRQSYPHFAADSPDLRASSPVGGNARSHPRVTAVR